MKNGRERERARANEGQTFLLIRIFSPLRSSSNVIKWHRATEQPEQRPATAAERQRTSSTNYFPFVFITRFCRRIIAIISSGFFHVLFVSSTRTTWLHEQRVLSALIVRFVSSFCPPALISSALNARECITGSERGQGDRWTLRHNALLDWSIFVRIPWRPLSCYSKTVDLSQFFCFAPQSERVCFCNVCGS